MALIKCRECGNLISNQAEKCPNCGCPVNGTELQITNNAFNSSQPANSNHNLLYAIVGGLTVALIGLGIFLWNSGALSKKDDDAVQKDTVVKVIVEKETANVAAQPQEAKTMLIYSNSYDGFVNIRQRPSAQSAILGELVNGGSPATFISSSGKWYKVSYNGIVGYVHKNYVKVKTISQGSSSSASGGTVYYVVIGSWQSLSMAKQFYRELPSGLDNGSIYKAVANGKVVYRMCVAQFSSKSQAKSWMSSYSNYGYTLWIWESHGEAQCVYRP